MAANKRRVVLVGGGGHCMSVLDSLRASGTEDEIGIVDLRPLAVSGVPYLGQDGDLPALFEQGWDSAVVTLGSVGNAKRRMALYAELKRIGFSLPAVVDPSAVIAKNTFIAEGAFVGKRAVINENASVGACAIINSGAIVEHDCIIGDFSHISPGAVLCGGVTIGKESHIGAGATVIQGISIGEQTTIGAGSVVLRDIAPQVVAFGNPCREVKRK